MTKPDLRICFRWHMRLAETFRRAASERGTVGRAAIVAMERARADVAAGRVRYVESDGGPGKPFAAYGERHMRWIEKPESFGLRFVGLAHDLARIDHTGWFLDSTFQDETARGVVYALPGRDGRARLVPGIADPYQSDKYGRGPALISFDHFYIAESGGTAPEAFDVAHLADQIAERYAEKERDYQDAFRAGAEWADLATAIADQ